MSVISIQAEDKSDFLCKRFAEMVSRYFDEPAQARTAAAQVPLENLFRVLEMYRNDTFSDEPRKGVFAFEMPITQLMKRAEEDSWHLRIKDAVQRSITTSFGTEAGNAVTELQGALRWLALDGDLPDRERTVQRAKTFFGQLSAAL